VRKPRKLAKELDSATKRGVDLGLTDDEVAFYDALAANESAVIAMGDNKLRVIAADLITQVRQSVTIDWTLRVGARAKIQVMVKRILNKYVRPQIFPNATALRRRSISSNKYPSGMGSGSSPIDIYTDYGPSKQAERDMKRDSVSCERPVSQLSGGQRQRVLLARALAANPDCLLLDEPTAGVDVHTQHIIASVLSDFQRSAAGAVVLVTHEPSAFLKVATGFLKAVSGTLEKLDVSERLNRSKALNRS